MKKNIKERVYKMKVKRKKDEGNLQREEMKKKRKRKMVNDV